MSLLINTYISGGTANTNALISFGGAISTTPVTHQVCTYQANAPTFWPQIVRASGLNVGRAIDYDNNLTEYYTLDKVGDAWQIYYDLGTGISAYKKSEVTVTTPGLYQLLIDGTDRTGSTRIQEVVIDVTATAMSAVNDWWRFFVTEQATNLFNDITFSEMVTGSTVYRCVYYKNEDIVDVSVQFHVNEEIAHKEYTLGLDPVGVNGVAQTIATETDVPVGVNFSSKTLGATLPPNGTIAVWIKRELPPNWLYPKKFNIICTSS